MDLDINERRILNKVGYLKKQLEKHEGHFKNPVEWEDRIHAFNIMRYYQGRLIEMKQNHPDLVGEIIEFDEYNEVSNAAI